MHNVERARRRSGILLTVGLVLFAGAATLVLVGYRGLAGWAVLLSTFANLMTAIAIRRSLGRLPVAPTHRDPAG